MESVVVNKFLIPIVVSTALVFNSTDEASLYTQLYEEVQALTPEAHLSTIFARSTVLSPWFHSDRRLDESVRMYVTDETVQANWLSRRLGGDLFVKYKTILSNAQWGRLPFDENQQADFEEIMAELFQESETGIVRTEAYERFILLFQAFDKVRIEWENTPVPRPRALERRYERVKRDLAIKGERAKFEDLEIRFRRYLAYDFSKSHARLLQNRFDSNISQVGQPITETSEEISFQALGRRIVIETNLNSRNEVPYGFEPTDAITGFWVDDPSGVTLLDSPENVTITATISRHDIRRPWMDVDLLSSSRGWTWDGGNVANGRPANDDSDGMPFTGLVVATILVHHISISGDWPESLIERIRASSENGEIIRLGPIVVSGLIQTPIGDVTVRPFPTSKNEIYVPCLQLIGGDFGPSWTSLSPNPREDLIWNDPLPDYPLRERPTSSVLVD